MVKCLLCQRSYNKAFDISFHRFPSDQATRRLWYKITDHGERSPTDSVCSIHFADDCFQVHKELGQRILKPYSIPTLWLTKVQPKKLVDSLEAVLTEHNYVARLEESEKPKPVEPQKYIIKYPYVLNNPPCNIAPKIVVPEVKLNIPVTYSYQPLVTNIAQPLSGNMMYALKINPTIPSIPTLPSIPMIPPKKVDPVKSAMLAKKLHLLRKEEAKRKALAKKKRRDEIKLHETTLRKLQTVSKKVVDQRQTIKMLRQKLRRLETRFDMQKTLIKHLNSKLEVPKERPITLIAHRFE